MSAQSSLPIIVDTDAGTDDMIALAYLLSVPDVHIEAITVVHGLAHVREGARNVRRLLYLAGKANIPVFEGEERPVNGYRGFRPFPDEWRGLSDRLPGVDLPQIADPPSTEGAVTFLKTRLGNPGHPVRILALGPLTHFGIILQSVPEAVKTIDQLVIMGGAVSVPGNLSGGNPGKPANEVAEWNIYGDPQAADVVFKSGIQTLLVPLDATMHVPISRNFVEDFRRHNLTPLGRVVLQVLEAALPLIDTHTYFAWDPLAAAALVDASLLTVRQGAVKVVTGGRNIGRTKLVKWNPGSRLSIALDANADRFQTVFERAFTK